MAKVSVAAFNFFISAVYLALLVHLTDYINNNVLTFYHIDNNVLIFIHYKNYKYIRILSTYLPCIISFIGVFTNMLVIETKTLRNLLNCCCVLHIVPFLFNMFDGSNDLIKLVVLFLGFFVSVCFSNSWYKSAQQNP